VPLPGGGDHGRSSVLALLRLAGGHLLSSRCRTGFTRDGLSIGSRGSLATLVLGVFGQHALRIKQITALDQVGFIGRRNQAPFFIDIVAGGLRAQQCAATQAQGAGTLQQAAK
jgi:hypothetical protein